MQWKIPNLLRRNGARLFLGLLLVSAFLLHAAGVMHIDFVNRLEYYAYDLRLKWTMPNTLDQRVVILNIDEASLQKEGHWPWPRNKLARMVDLLFDDYKIAVLGFDIVFAERDESSGLRSLEHLAEHSLRGNMAFKASLEQIRPALDYDRIFADSLKNRAVVLGYIFSQQAASTSQTGQLPPPVIAQEVAQAAETSALQAGGFTANLPELQRAASSGGFFNSLQDADGVSRRVSILQQFDGALYETLGLAVARLALREPKVELVYEDAEKSAVALEAVQVGGRRIAVDSNLAALIPYRGKQGSFLYVSASDVLNKVVPLDDLQDAIVLMGTTAPGLNDLRTAPMQRSYAGVEAHANMVAGILDESIKERPAYVQGVEWVVLFLVGVFLSLLLPVLSPVWATIVSGLTALAFVSFNLSMWMFANLALPAASGLVLIAALYFFSMSYGFFVDSRGKRLLAGRFGQYVPTELVNEMALDPKAYTVEGESRNMTVLFSDVRGFTTISERLRPAELTELMRMFLTPMTQVIHRHRGTIDKYMGDAIMAFWGAPVRDEHHARNTLLAAMDMIASLDALQPQLAARGWPAIKIGIGLNTGEMVVGNMGSEFRLAYTVMGDAVNLGSRLEAATKDYGVQIIVSAFTKAAVPDFVFRELDVIRVKGKETAVAIFEPVCPTVQASASVLDELDRYHAALGLYRAQRWAEAKQAFGALKQHSPERYLYDLYFRRAGCEMDRAAGPA